ncbi:hypothetical protein O3M35_012248 [Rhynocoris fuscipes]|uniref:Uncharacterized protein n=1 Tax=Rhynocoris fuscipes TaxID=488301 RepID=A0AAW1CSV6_9HEMI
MNTESSSIIISPVDYPNTKYYLLPNFVSTDKIKSGSIVLNLNTKESLSFNNTNNNNTENSNNEDRNSEEKFKLIKEPRLTNINNKTKLDKVESILNSLKNDPVNSELKISYFYISCKSIPNKLLNSLNCRNTDWITLLNLLPKFTQINRNFIFNLPECLINVLYWLLNGFKKPKIYLTNAKCIQNNIKFENVQQPFIIFKVRGNKLKNNSITGFNKRTAFGYLPVNNSDVFAMLYNWKNSGKNKCINDKFKHALELANLQPIWPQFSIGKWIKTILVIEYFMHPSITYVGDVPGTSLSLSLDLNSSDPPGYYLINNCDLARISHILIYREDNSILNSFKYILTETYHIYGSLFTCLLASFLIATILKKISWNKAV